MVGYSWANLNLSLQMSKPCDVYFDFFPQMILFNFACLWVDFEETITNLYKM